MGRSAALFRKSVLRRIVAKVAAESFLIVGVLFLLVCFVGYHVDAYLTHTLELAVSRQVDTVAHSVGQQLNQEMIQTEHSAWLISQGRVHPEEMVEAVNHWTNRQLPRGNIQTGVISQDDTVIAGSRPPGKKDLKLDRRIYDGKRTIRHDFP